jgi:hypothetical protein
MAVLAILLSFHPPGISPAFRKMEHMQPSASWSSQLYMLYCQATNKVKQNHIQDQERAKYQLRVRYLPVVQVMEKWIAVNQSDQVSVSCAYQANPYGLVGVKWFHNNIMVYKGNKKNKIRV